MVKYCDSAWERCPYAITISHVWEQINSDMEKQKENNSDDFTYSDNIDGYRFESGEFW